MELPKPFSGKINRSKDILGKGAYGVVYRGTYEDEQVAVKRIQLDTLGSEDREVKLQIKLDHENVLKILTVEDDDDFRYIVLELCEGTLEHVCNGKYEGPKLPPDEDIMYSIANGLKYIHSQKLVHRDIKPENILISSKTSPVQVKLSDFGLSKEINTRNTCSMSGFKGTHLWMAAELLEMSSPKSKSKASTSSDVFSSGCVFFYFSTRGIHPFGDENHVVSNILANKFSLTGANSDLLTDIVRGMIHFEPQKRSSLQQVMEKLRPPQTVSAAPAKKPNHTTEKCYSAEVVSEGSSEGQFVMTTRMCNDLTQDEDAVMWRCRFHPISPILAVGLKNGKVFLIESESHDSTFHDWLTETSLAGPKSLAKSSGLRAMEWNINGTRLAAGFGNGFLVVWNHPGGEIIKNREQKHGIEKIYWSPFDPRLLVVLFNKAGGAGAANGAGTISVCNLNSRANLRVILETCYIWDVAWVSELELAVGCEDGIIRIVGIKEGEVGVQKKLRHGDKIPAVVWNETMKTLASGSWAGTTKVWSLNSTKRPIHELDVKTRCQCLAWYPSWKTEKETQYSGSIACGLRNGNIAIWNPIAETFKFLSAHIGSVGDISFSPDGQFLASVGAVDENIIIWSTKSWKKIGFFEMKSRLLIEHKVSWSSNSQKLIVSSKSSEFSVIERPPDRERM